MASKAPPPGVDPGTGEITGDYEAVQRCMKKGSVTIQVFGEITESLQDGIGEVAWPCATTTAAGDPTPMTEVTAP